MALPVEITELGTLTTSRGDGNEIKVRLQRNTNGSYSLDIREWYWDNNSGEMRPGKGCRVKMAEVDVLAEILTFAVEEMEADQANQPETETAAAPAKERPPAVAGVKRGTKVQAATEKPARTRTRKVTK